MSNSEHAHDTVIEQQREIASLRLTNTALRARVSLLRTRLLAALDTLDSLQSGHASELNALHDANAILERRWSSVAELLKETIDERDDLRDAVERFIEKLELADGFHAVPVSKISSFRLLEPVPLGFRKSRDGQLGTPEGLLTPALVQTLQTELAREKEEHRHTWREAAAQIAALRAQVARRDAELEDITLWVFEENNHLAARHEPPKLTQKEARTLRAEVHTRRRDLDREVRKLNVQLEETRQLRSKKLYSPPSKPSRATEGLSEQETVVPEAPEPKAWPAVGIAEPQKYSPPRRGSEPQPSTPTGPTHKSANSQTQTHLTAAIFTTTPLKSGPGLGGIPPTAPVTGRKIPDVFLPTTPPTHIPQSSEGTRGVHPDVARGVEDLDQKIHALAEVMEGFKTERANLLNISPEQLEKKKDATTLENEMPEVWLLEEECIRLREALRSSNHMTPPRRGLRLPEQWDRQEGFDTPVRRSSNAHLTEITLNQEPSPFTLESRTLLSPLGVGEHNLEQAAANPSSISAVFDATETVFSSTDDDYRGDTESTSSIPHDSTADIANTGQASDSYDLTPSSIIVQS